MKAAVITVSDRSARGEREDLSGPVVKELLASADFEVGKVLVIPDERRGIESLLRQLVAEDYPLVITTGGTGFSERDVTPEATLAVIDRRADGLAEAMRLASLEKTKFAMLSRAVCGMAGKTIIVNLPGSPKGAKECLEVILPVLPHGIELLRPSSEEVDHTSGSLK